MNPSSFSRFSSARAASVAWWSPGKLAVSFLDGSVAVVDVYGYLDSDAARRDETNDTPSGGDFCLTERFDAFSFGGGVLLAACPRPRGGTTTRETGSVLETETERPRVAVLEFPGSSGGGFLTERDFGRERRPLGVSK
jgi:hypothetical protein